MIPSGPLFHKPASVIAARNILFAALSLYVLFFLLAHWAFEPSGHPDFKSASLNAVVLVLLYIAIHFIGHGKNWARILFIIVFVGEALSCPYYLRMLINTNWFLEFMYSFILLLQALALFFLLRKPTTSWFNRFNYPPPPAD